MKKILLVAIALISTQYIFAQTEITRETGGTKIIKGFIAKKELATDTAFAWYAQNSKGYTPAADVMQQYTVAKDSVNLIIFAGTWCGDTKNLLPKFFTTTDAAGFPDSRITLIGVDRSKKTLYNLTEAFGVTNVPTFIVMKNGKEIGRVVEYGKMGSPDKEVAQIISGAAGR
ncbi:MAG TPA: thioredoxin family protein [Flavisolibacter sp.]|jgi:thiol-disulfide isomerase/thioredoxin|nr:thioredoxin family protein [Flavisolibacter sp.]